MQKFQSKSISNRLVYPFPTASMSIVESKPNLTQQLRSMHDFYPKPMNHLISFQFVHKIYTYNGKTIENQTSTIEFVGAEWQWNFPVESSKRIDWQLILDKIQ